MACRKLAQGRNRYQALRGARHPRAQIAAAELGPDPAFLDDRQSMMLGELPQPRAGHSRVIVRGIWTMAGGSRERIAEIVPVERDMKPMGGEAREETVGTAAIGNTEQEKPA